MRAILFCCLLLIITKTTGVRSDESDSMAKQLICSPAGPYFLAGGVGAGAVIGAATVLPLLGFGPLGIVGGSFAAIFQSTIGGGIAQGSMFAMLQSAGMTASTSIFTKAGITSFAGLSTTEIRNLLDKYYCY